MNKMTQHEMIVHYMRQHGSLTSLEAAHKLNITKLTTRISEMRRHKGIAFVEVSEGDYNRYSLAQTETNNQILKELGYIK